ncbi:hypothetical protein [Frigoriglobus tundricola]|uniref:Uncharacterized protein n=1 Tax=Frigoriglobus tundricola TaxID=2774151 RepID=A0A6M5YFH2_9BACT|nr:hypothetical protein [Frigoriglobus tundricola]QJW92728.1 hypothetical protein FTUN_0225 [Frigoriglobus tundricola]
MTNLLGQLERWRAVERAVRLVWGAGRWVAIIGAVLAAACLTDWLADRYLGSESWRKVRKATWVFAPPASATAEEQWATERLRLHFGLRLSPDAHLGETPKWLRAGITGAQVLLACGLAYLLLLRPWLRTPPVDELAGSAEKAIPEFGHRLVTAVQLNRPAARTQGMSKVLIAQVTREAGELAERHNLLKLINYARLALAAAVALPVLALWAGFALARPELASVLLRRQALADVEIPRTIHLKNVSQDVWPTGAEAEVRYKVTGNFDRETVGRLRVEPDGQPEEYYDLTFERDAADGGAYFRAKLPAASTDFNFSARLGNGRTRGPGRVRFEPPPTAVEIESWQLLPKFLGTRDGTPDGPVFERQNDGAKRGEIVDALPLSSVRIGAAFSKPVRSAVLVRVERGEGTRERELPALPPRAVSGDRTAAEWTFPTSERMIAYRLELVDDRGFVNAVPIRRNVRMMDDRPPAVAFMPETTRHPNPADFEGQGDPRVYEWGDKMPLPEGGRVMVIYRARSEQGISRANIRYRVFAKGVASDSYPETIQKIQHPRDDPENKVYERLALKPIAADARIVGKFVPDLGLFEKSWEGLTGLKRPERMKTNIEFYSLPSPAPGAVPAGLEAGGRYMFEIDGLQKKVPDGSGGVTNAKLELGDTVELFVEVFDKNPTPNRPAGYTREARLKIVVSPEDAAYAIRTRDEQNKRLQDKLRELTADQANVFREETEPPKK